MTLANAVISTWKAGSPETGSGWSSHCTPWTVFIAWCGSGSWMFLLEPSCRFDHLFWAPKWTCFPYLCDLKWPYCGWGVACGFTGCLGVVDAGRGVGFPLFLLASLDTRERTLKSTPPITSRTASLHPEEAWLGRLYLPLAFHASLLAGTAAPLKWAAVAQSEKSGVLWSWATAS